jgi:hypothetical protein
MSGRRPITVWILETFPRSPSGSLKHFMAHRHRLGMGLMMSMMSDAHQSRALHGHDRVGLRLDLGDSSDALNVPDIESRERTIREVSGDPRSGESLPRSFQVVSTRQGEEEEC